MKIYNPVDFNGRWIVMSGATSGIGTIIASVLSSLNANLILIGRSTEKLDRLAGLLPADRYKLIISDLENAVSIGKMDTILSEVGEIYGLCHCAGVVDSRPLNTTGPESINKQLSINLVAGIELARMITKRKYIPPDGGSLLFISSVYAHVGAPAQIGYCASKGAVNAMVRAMAIELAPKKIRVNSLSPGFVETEMTTKHSRLSKAQIEAIIARHPLGGGTPMDIARATVFLLDPMNRWITGTDLIIDGGFTSQ